VQTPIVIRELTLNEKAQSRGDNVMKASKFILNSAALIALMVPAAFAQQSGSSSTNTTTANPPTVQQRKENQQDRIANGIQSGQLTAGETKNLETKEAGLNKEEKNMRSADNGKLTSADRTKLQGQQNNLSNKIYQDKHNANTAHYGNNQVGQRRENQQDRIANGVRNGSLTAGQTAKLENKEQGVNRTVSGMRQANGGKLTNADKKAVNQQQNKVSKQIYNKKHS
jgi:hypothetical protein